jgi:hypothetical protein
MSKPLFTSLAMATLLAVAAQSAVAQWPAGTPRDNTGSRPSPMGNPTPQEEMETHRNEQGQVVTEDGRVVKGMPKDETTPNRNMNHTDDEPSTGKQPHHSGNVGELE